MFRAVFREENCGFQSPQENTILCRSNSSTLSATVCFVHTFSLASVCDFTSHIYKRCFAAH